METLFRKEPLTLAMEAIVAAGGSERQEARLVAENLVMANLLGHDSHGIGMIPRYIDALLEGGLSANQRVRATLDTGTLLALDGGRGYGQSIGRQAMEMAIERAKQHGSCIMSLGNSHHLGRIGHWAEMAVAAGFVSLHFVNVLSHARVAPYGGRDARFGTNPCCIAIPLPGEPPFVLDYATSAVAQGKLRVAHNKGDKVPFGRLIDTEGNPTQDPRYAVVPPFGAMLPFGEHKGYGMAVACELLGGALTGGGTWHFGESSQQRVLNGMLTVVLDARRLGTADAFEREARAFLAWLRQARPAPGVDRVRIAGEPEREMRERRERQGIPVDETTWREIERAASKVELVPQRINALARG
ncbi:MAG TPA: malate/lactate/ureidoglycolate dehydrogenase [Burkholderiales bacterium]|nr:malate/lactate/ureidoglycolate dehydrogenase [Burkholderiales bacterium]